MNHNFQPTKTIIKLKRIKKEIEETIAYMENYYEKFKNRPFCKKCKRTDVRVRKDNSYFCRSCGYDSSCEDLQNIDDVLNELGGCAK